MLIKAIDGVHKGTVFDVPDSCVDYGIYETIVPALKPLRFSAHAPAKPAPIERVTYYVSRVSKYSYVLTENKDAQG